MTPRGNSRLSRGSPDETSPDAQQDDRERSALPFIDAGATLARRDAAGSSPRQPAYSPVPSTPQRYSALASPPALLSWRAAQWLLLLFVGATAACVLWD